MSFEHRSQTNCCFDESFQTLDVTEMCCCSSSALLSCIVKTALWYKHAALSLTQVYGCLPCDVFLINFIAFLNYMSFPASCYDSIHIIRIHFLMLCIRKISCAHPHTDAVFIIQMGKLQITVKHRSRFASTLTTSSGSSLQSQLHRAHLCTEFHISHCRVDAGCNKKFRQLYKDSNIKSGECNDQVSLPKAVAVIPSGFLCMSWM